MDWKRIKTILIFALLVINGLLVWTLYEEKSLDDTTFIDQEILMSLIEDKNIALGPNLLQFNKEIPNIEVKVQGYDQAFVDDFVEIVNYSDSNFGRQRFKVNNNEIFYNVEIEDESLLEFTTMSDDQMIAQAMKLLKDLNISTEDVFLKSIGNTGKKTIIIFEQKYSGFVIKDARIEMKYNNDKLLGLKRIWYDVVQAEQIQQELYSTEFALYKFIGQLYSSNPDRERTLVIDDIQLVYKLRQSDKSGDTIATEGEANIFYEIRSSEGEFLIEADAKGE